MSRPSGIGSPGSLTFTTCRPVLSYFLHFGEKQYSVQFLQTAWPVFSFFLHLGKKEYLEYSFFGAKTIFRGIRAKPLESKVEWEEKLELKNRLSM